MRQFKIRVVASIWHRPKDETDRDNITYRRRTQRLQTNSIESAKEWANNLQMYQGCKILWLKEVNQDGTETRIL